MLPWFVRAITPPTKQAEKKAGGLGAKDPRAVTPGSAAAGATSPSVASIGGMCVWTLRLVVVVCASVR